MGVRRRPGRALFSLLACILALCAGCGVESGSPADRRLQAERVLAPQPLPPTATLAASAGWVPGELGTTCWSQGSRHGCGDAGFLDPPQALNLNAGEEITLAFDRSDVPMDLAAIAYDGPSSEGPAEPLTIDEENPSYFRGDFAPGEHWLLVQSSWPEGHATHYFKFRVS